MASASNSASGDQANGYTTNGYTDLARSPSRRCATAPTRRATTTGATSTRLRTATTCSFTPTRTGQGTPTWARHSARGSTRRSPPANVVQNSRHRDGQGERLQRGLDRGLSRSSPTPRQLFKYNAILFFTSRDVLDDAGRRAAGLHRGRRRVHRRAQRLRHQLQLGLVPRACSAAPNCTTTPPSRQERSTSSTRTTPRPRGCQGRGPARMSGTTWCPPRKACGSSPRSTTARSSRGSRATTATQAWARSTPSPGASTTTAARHG